MTTKPANKMWGGRFAVSPSDVMEEINASVAYDQRFARQDLEGSVAHAEMLGAQGIIKSQDVKAIKKGLAQIGREIDQDAFVWQRGLEDVHMNIENRLSEIIGPSAGRLHTARSRNDQVATDFRLYMRDRIDQFDASLAELQLTLARKAEQYADVVMPGFTHLQPAQPVTFGHHLLAYVEMFARDRGRLADARKRLNQCPLGAAALAGTSFPIDRTATADALGFDKPTANSLDSVSDRDFVIETLSAATLAGMHLSRFAEEIVIWMTPQFGFVTLSDGWTTGSSIMPQKRNPDAAELVRAKVGRIAGAFTSLVLVMKGLPLAYSKDMQEDKEVTFDALDSFAIALAAMSGMAADLEPVPDRMAAAAGAGFSTATDLADWLVRQLGLPFRDAHHVTGALVAKAEAAGCGLEDLSLADMQDAEPRITDAIYDVLGVENSVRSRKSFGGTAPQLVRKSAKGWVRVLEKQSANR
ncbi:MAG: argininosuccinate lyase [Pseudomonadota bacterium]